MGNVAGARGFGEGMLDEVCLAMGEVAGCGLCEATSKVYLETVCFICSSGWSEPVKMIDCIDKALKNVLRLPFCSRSAR